MTKKLFVKVPNPGMFKEKNHCVRLQCRFTRIKLRSRTVYQKHRSMLVLIMPPGIQGFMYSMKSIVNNGCNYKGPKEGKSVMNNLRAAVT